MLDRLLLACVLLSGCGDALTQQQCYAARAHCTRPECARNALDGSRRPYPALVKQQCAEACRIGRCHECNILLGGPGGGL